MSSGDELYSLAEMDFVFEVFRLVQFGEYASFGWQSWDCSFGNAEILYLAKLVIRLTCISASLACSFVGNLY